MGAIGRPSEIYAPIREARCDRCRRWIRIGGLRAHYEIEHPRQAEPGEELPLREISKTDRIAELVEMGAPLSAAAAACGVPYRTVVRWMEWGAAQEEAHGPDATAEEIPAARVIFWRFWQAITHAREAAKAAHVQAIRDAPDWRARAWMLERMYPEEFGRLERLHVGADRNAGPIRVIHTEEDPAFVEEVTRIYRDAGVFPDVDSGPSTNGREPEGG